MQAALHIKTTVLPGQRVEITAPDLKEGEAVDVFLVLPPASSPARRSALEIIRSLHGHRLFQTPEDVDDYLLQERASWDRFITNDYGFRQVFGLPLVILRDELTR